MTPPFPLQKNIYMRDTVAIFEDTEMSNGEQNSLHDVVLLFF